MQFARQICDLAGSEDSGVPVLGSLMAALSSEAPPVCEYEDELDASAEHEDMEVTPEDKAWLAQQHPNVDEAGLALLATSLAASRSRDAATRKARREGDGQSTAGRVVIKIAKSKASGNA